MELSGWSAAIYWNNRIRAQMMAVGFWTWWRVRSGITWLTDPLLSFVVTWWTTNQLLNSCDFLQFQNYLYLLLFFPICFLTEENYCWCHMDFSVGFFTSPSSLWSLNFWICRHSQPSWNERVWPVTEMPVQGCCTEFWVYVDYCDFRSCFR